MRNNRLFSLIAVEIVIHGCADGATAVPMRFPFKTLFRQLRWRISVKRHNFEEPRWLPAIIYGVSTKITSMAQ